MTKTPNIGLNLPDFNETPWHDEINENFRSIDATIKSIIGLTNLKGPYVNSTAVTIGQRYFDDTDGQFYEAQSNFTTLAAPNTFDDERTAHPDRWEILDSALNDDYMLKTQNLADVTNLVAARENLGLTPGEAAQETLGLGTAALDDTEDFATAAQGSKADTAIQPATHERSFRNLVINGAFTINQRAAATKAQSVGVYGYDRWKGHADGLEQVVEQAMVPAGTYTLSWSGGGNGRLNGGGLAASPITASLPGTGNVSVVVPATATNVQLELGSVVTPFERRHTSIEFLLCARYYWFLGGNIFLFSPAADGQTYRYHNFMFPVEMRAAPTITFAGPGTMNSAHVDTKKAMASQNVFSNTATTYLTYAIFDAEL